MDFLNCISGLAISLRVMTHYILTLKFMCLRCLPSMLDVVNTFFVLSVAPFIQMFDSTSCMNGTLHRAWNMSMQLSYV